jgi:hypothetical protein
MAHKAKESEKKLSSHLPHKPSNKGGSTFPHKAQNTKRQYQDWMPNE